LLPVALIGLAAISVFALHGELAGGDARAGAVVLTVNSTANTDDGDCDHPATGTDDCTFHEAIDAVNAGLGDEINFHPPVFSPDMPGVINLEGGEGCLPDIERDVVIDATNAGVVLDGDQDDNQTPTGCFAALFVSAAHNGFDFALMGGGPEQFIIRELNAEGAIELDGDALGGPFSFGDVLIDNIRIEDIQDAFTCCGDGISIFDTTNLNNIAITNNSIQTDGTDIYENAGDGIFMTTDDTDLTNNVVDVSGNEILAGDDAVDIDLQGDVNDEGDTPRDLTVSVSDNPLLTGGTGSFNRGVELSYCDDSSCSIDNSEIDFAVNDNGEVTSDNDGISVIINGDDDSDAAEANVDVNGNANVDSSSEDGIDVDISFCCEDSDSQAEVHVDGNADVVAEDDAVDIDADVCCGDANEAQVTVSGNGLLQGEDVGVDISTRVGEIAFGGPEDSDGNQNEVTVENNARIDGGGDNGVEIDGDIGSDGGDADENESIVTVAGNADIDGGGGDGDGVNIDIDIGSEGGQADENESTVTVADNAEIDGGGSDGVDIENEVGTDGLDGDNNIALTEVTDNEQITGHDDDGVDIQASAAGTLDGSEENSNTITVAGNGDIRGQGGDNDDDGEGGDGVFIDPMVCCDSANTNVIDVSDNVGEIVGLDSDGIEIGDSGPGVCCSLNVITVLDNVGAIRGNDSNGIELNVCEFPEGAGAVAEGAALDCVSSSVTFATISGNNISNSEDDGINICCGAFELDGVGKSVISDNTINGNGQDGVDLDSIVGMNVGPENTISGNGNGPGDAGVEIDRNTSTDIWEATDEINDALCGGAGVCDIVLPAHNNTVTENSIFNNAGLGIDLDGDLDYEGTDGADDESEVGCVADGKAPFEPNDCIPYPTITIIAAGDKVGGTACAECTIELYLADADPDDQTGPLNRQHGEGQTFLLSGVADETGVFSIVLPCGLSAGDVTATATDKLKNTSEFAANAPFLGSRSCATATPTVTNTVVAPTSTAAPPTATPLAKACGDVNDDGSVDSIDAALVLQLVAGLIDQVDNPASADADGDGEITSIDAALILQFTAALLDTLGC
jgi:hypothetical protein